MEIWDQFILFLRKYKFRYSNFCSSVKLGWKKSRRLRVQMLSPQEQNIFKMWVFWSWRFGSVYLDCVGFDVWNSLLVWSVFWVVSQIPLPPLASWLTVSLPQSGFRRAYLWAYFQSPSIVLSSSGSHLVLLQEPEFKYGPKQYQT